MARRPISLSLRFSVFERDRYTCQYCGRQSPDVVLHVDHAMPVALGGDNRIDNLLTACSECNIGKGARDPGLAMPRRPRTILERAYEVKAAATDWAETAFRWADPATKGLMWEIASRVDFAGAELAYPDRRPEAMSLLRGLVAVGAVRIGVIGLNVVIVDPEVNRGREDDPDLPWGLRCCGPIFLAPGVAEVH